VKAENRDNDIIERAGPDFFDDNFSHPVMLLPRIELAQPAQFRERKGISGALGAPGIMTDGRNRQQGE
jgi:hypothetical protein